jgi:hypothetical protein
MRKAKDQRGQGSILSGITAGQIADSLLAVPAFVPATVCPGYLAAWYSNLFQFRERSIVERLYWSVPLSFAVSTIACVLISRFLSVGAASIFLVACGMLWIGTVAAEWLRLRRSGGRWAIGLRPGGAAALALACILIAVVVLALVDIASGHRLFISVVTLDLGTRVNWTESVLRTGVPPANPLYWYGHAASLRQYYFWYVVCAALVRLWRLPVRAIFVAGSVWSGFGLAALLGLYLKHFLDAGAHLRRRFLVCICLLGVAGLDIVAVLWNTFALHRPIPLVLEWWAVDQVTSWMDSILWVPHHLIAMLCCMLAFLLVWIQTRSSGPVRATVISLVACTMASAFGLSIYVAFGFFLIMAAWSVWQLAGARAWRPVLLLALGGVGSAILLLPYLWELTHTPSYVKGGRMFSLAVREMIPASQLLATAFFQHLSTHHPVGAKNLANLVLLVPGFALELGFYLIVLAVCCVPALRGRARLNDAQRSLVFLSLATIVVISGLRSSIIQNNDFGWRVALFLQFSLLLLGAELLDGWRSGRRGKNGEERQNTPSWVVALAALTLMIGALSTVSQAAMLRFGYPIAEANLARAHVPNADRESHTAYISYLGFADLDKAIPRTAIVQYNPAYDDVMYSAIDQLSVDHQVVIAGDQGGCGSELGGDPRGCPAMAAALDRVFRDASPEQAHAVCRQFGIDDLVARVYDPAWQDRSGWVWTLPAVVADPEFRALDCR